MAELDLTKLADKHHLEAHVTTPESPQEQESRLRREEADATSVRRIREAKFWMLAAALFGLAGICVYIMLSSSPRFSADDRKWATSILTALATGAIGFITGQQTAKS